jgi:hypothetical protein
VKESPIFIKSYEMLTWLLNHTRKFPKHQRFVMARRMELRRKRFEAEFEVWLTELPDEKKKQIAGGVSLGSHAARSILRAEYAKEVGFDLQGE